MKRQTKLLSEQQADAKTRWMGSRLLKSASRIECSGMRIAHDVKDRAVRRARHPDAFRTFRRSAGAA
jgi:hypothetical protein